jgi:F1F0 ATPase subunit 2
MSDVQTKLLQSTAELSAGFLVGILLGLAFFGGLWWTTQRLISSHSPALLVIASLFLRMSVLAVGLFAMSQVGAGAVVAAGCGALLVRCWMIRGLGRPSTGAHP